MEGDSVDLANTNILSQNCQYSCQRSYLNSHKT